MQTDAVSEITSISKSELSDSSELYGKIAADRYDRDFLTMARKYRTAHSLQNSLVNLVLEASRSEVPVVVDFGCGTANDGIEILRTNRNARYVGIDRSEPMLLCASDKLVKQRLSCRAHLLIQDFRHVTTEAIRQAFEPKFGPHAEVLCVISALALHHYSYREKEGLYRSIGSMLPTGGFFINTDLFSSPTPLIADWCLDEEIREVCAARFSFDASVNSSTTTLTERHYREENDPIPLDEEFSLLKSAGFKPDVVYRNAQLCTIVAQR